MAHQIYYNEQTQRHSFFSVKEKPWHNLGQVVEDYPTSAAAIAHAGLDFEVEKRRLFTPSSSIVTQDFITAGRLDIPGAVSRDVAKASADRSIQTLGLTGLTDSWGAQAAGMGIEAAKSLMSKKVKLIKVVVKAGYQVLLYDEKQKN